MESRVSMEFVLVVLVVVVIMVLLREKSPLQFVVIAVIVIVWGVVHLVGVLVPVLSLTVLVPVVLLWMR